MRITKAVALATSAITWSLRSMPALNQSRPSLAWRNETTPDPDRNEAVVILDWSDAGIAVLYNTDALNIGDKLEKLGRDAKEFVESLTDVRVTIGPIPLNHPGLGDLKIYRDGTGINPAVLRNALKH